MRIIGTKIFNKEIDRSFNDHISVSLDGLYAIRITASVKAWWQHITTPRSFLKKDSLTVRLDDEGSVPIDVKKKLRADDIWNGNILKGNEITLSILVSLKKGNHTLSFVSHGKPFLDTVSIFQIADNTFSLVSLSPSSRDRTPWLTFLFHKTAVISSISITARAEKRRNDDDDLQIRLDGIIEKNEVLRAHRDWFWCGKVLKGTARTFSRSFPHDAVPTRIELVADGTPAIDTLTFIISGTGDKSIGGGTVLWKELALREKPTTNTRIIKTLTQGSRFELLDRAVKGERPKNEQGVLLASDRWHTVRVSNASGFVYSEGVVIDGEDVETLQSFIRERAYTLGVDPCLAVAIAQIESKLFPYAVSQAGAQGPFQLKSAAFEDVNREYGKKFSDRFAIPENIDAGILYLLHLKKQFTNAKNWKELTLASWNWGKGNVIAMKPFAREYLPKETQFFITSVLVNEEHCIKGEGIRVSSKRSLTMLVVGVILFSAIGLSSYSASIFPPEMSPQTKIIEERIVDFDGDGRSDRFIVVFNPDDLVHYSLYYQRARDTASLLRHQSDGILSWIIGDVNENGKSDILIHDGYSGSAGFGTLVIYEWDGNSFKKIFWRSEVRSTFGFRNVDMSDHGNELVYYYYRRKWDQEDHEAVYRWNRDADVYELLTDQ